MLASVVGFLGDFDLAEEATADAFATAAERWPGDGVPPAPGGWLTTTAKRRAIDLIRRRASLADKLSLLELPESAVDDMDEIENPATVIADERLELIFMCCHLGGRRLRPPGFRSRCPPITCCPTASPRCWQSST